MKSNIITTWRTSWLVNSIQENCGNSCHHDWHWDSNIIVEEKCSDVKFCRLYFSAITTTDGTATTADLDYTDADGTITFAADDVAFSTTVDLLADADLEGLEFLTFGIAIADSTTAMMASVSAHANSAKIFIIDISSKCKFDLVTNYLFDRKYKASRE